MVSHRCPLIFVDGGESLAYVGLEADELSGCWTSRWKGGPGVSLFA